MGQTGFCHRGQHQRPGASQASHPIGRAKPVKQTSRRQSSWSDALRDMQTRPIGQSQVSVSNDRLSGVHGWILWLPAAVGSIHPPKNTTRVTFANSPTEQTKGAQPWVAVASAADGVSRHGASSRLTKSLSARATWRGHDRVLRLHCSIGAPSFPPWSLSPTGGPLNRRDAAILSSPVFILHRVYTVNTVVIQYSLADDLPLGLATRGCQDATISPRCPSSTYSPSFPPLSLFVLRCCASGTPAVFPRLLRGAWPAASLSVSVWVMRIRIGLA